MRPLKLTIEGINSFIEPQTVDFEAAGADNLFCISGSTGSGKTTIIDCVILALYRDGDRGNLDEYVNLRCERGKISFRFEMSGDVYETERVITRKKSGKNTYVLIKNGTPIAEGNEAFAAVSELIGLDVKEFTNVVVLQQGEFSRFLKTTKGARVALISKLFDLGRFDKAASAFSEKSRKLGAECDGLTLALENLCDVTDEGVKTAEAALKAGEQELKNLEKAAKDAEKANDEAVKNRDAFDDLEKKKQDLAAVEKAIKDHAEASVRATAAGADLETREKELKTREAARDGLVARKTTLEELAKRGKTLCEEEKRHEENKAALKKAEAELKDKTTALVDEKTACEKLRGEANEKAGAAELVGIFDGEVTAAEVVGATEKAKHEHTDAQRTIAAAVGAEGERDKAYADKVKAEDEWGNRNALHAEIVREAETAAENAKKARKSYDEAVRENALGTVMSGLKEGDDCPVCGGKITRLESHCGLSVEKAEVEAEKADRRSREATERLNKSSAAVAAAIEKANAAAKNYEEKKKAADEARKAANAVTPELIEKRLALLAELGRTVAARDAAEKRLADFGASVVRAEEQIRAAAAALETNEKRLKAERDAINIESGENPQAELNGITATLEQLKTEREKLDEDKKKYADGMAKMKEIADKNAGCRESLLAAIAEVKNAVFTSDEDLKKLADVLRETVDKKDAIRDFVVKSRTELERAKADLVKKTELGAKLKAAENERNKYADLEKLFKNKAFSEFVAEEYIKDFTAAASVRLGELTGGKYSFMYDAKDGKFYVRDFLSGNDLRGVNTLSGGETFLASLSLAIAISGMLSKDKNYEFFFIDEGFGTLSPDALDAVTDALDALSRKTMVGVITHRGELIERIQSVIKVEPSDGESGSRIIFG